MRSHLLRQAPQHGSCFALPNSSEKSLRPPGRRFKGAPNDCSPFWDAWCYLGRDQYIPKKFEAAERAFAEALRPVGAQDGMAHPLEALGHGEAAEDRFRGAVESSACGNRTSLIPRIDCAHSS